MTVAVVDRLEAVQVDIQHGAQLLLTAHRVERLVEPLAEADPVGQAGQRIVLRLVGQTCLQALALGDVLRDQHQERRVALALAHDAHGLAHPEQRAILAAVGLLDLRGKRAAVAGQLLAQESPGGAGHLGIAQVEDVAALQALGRASEHAREGLVDTQDPAFGADMGNAHGRLVEGRAKQRLAALQGIGRRALADQHQRQHADEQHHYQGDTDGRQQIGGAALQGRGHFLVVGRGHGDHQRIVGHAAVADDTGDAIEPLAAVVEVIGAALFLPLKPGQRLAAQAELAACADLARAHHAIQTAEFEQPLRAQVDLLKEVRDVLRTDGHHHHPGETAVRVLDTQRHGDQPALGHTPEDRLADEQVVDARIALRSEEFAIGVVDRAGAPAAADDVAMLVHHADDGEHLLADHSLLDPAPQVDRPALQTVLLAHERRHLLGRLQRAGHLLLEGDGQTGIGLHFRRQCLLTLEGDALQGDQPDNQNENARQYDQQVQGRCGSGASGDAFRCVTRLSGRGHRLVLQGIHGLYPASRWARSTPLKPAIVQRHGA